MRMLKKAGVVAGAILVAGGIATIVHLVGASADRSPAVASSPAPAPATVANPPGLIAQSEAPAPITADDGADVPSKDGAVSKYERLAACAKYERHRAFVKELKADPASWINSDAARAQLSPDDLNAVEKTLKFVEQHSAACEPVPQRGLASMVGMYEAALAAANAGDREAARCFVLAPWESALDDQGPTKALRELYAANAQKIVDASLQSGDWTMVASMVSMHQALHSHGGLQGVAFHTDPAKAYRYQQLIVLGATGKDAKRANERLDEIAKRVPAAERETQLKWATESYETSFKGRPYRTVAPACDF